MDNILPVMQPQLTDPKSFRSPTAKQLVRAGFRVVGDWVYGWRTPTSTCYGGTKYKQRATEYWAMLFNPDPGHTCSHGIYLAGSSWMRNEWVGVEDAKRTKLVPVRCRRDEMLSAGDKFRCMRLWVIGKAELCETVYQRELRAKKRAKAKAKRAVAKAKKA